MLPLSIPTNWTINLKFYKGCIYFRSFFYWVPYVCLLSSRFKRQRLLHCQKWWKIDFPRWYHNEACSTKRLPFTNLPQWNETIDFCPGTFGIWSEMPLANCHWRLHSALNTGPKLESIAREGYRLSARSFWVIDSGSVSGAKSLNRKSCSCLMRHAYGCFGLFLSRRKKTREGNSVEKRRIGNEDTLRSRHFVYF